MDGNRAEPRAEEKKVEPNFELSGALAEETNTVNNVALVYSEPPEAAQPTQRWRLYTFKGGQSSVCCQSALSAVLADCTDGLISWSTLLVLV